MTKMDKAIEKMASTFDYLGPDFNNGRGSNKICRPTNKERV
jgi:hypothetical protein